MLTFSFFWKTIVFFRFPIVFCFVFWSLKKLTFFKVFKTIVLKMIRKRKKRSFNDRFQKRLTTLHVNIHIPIKGGCCQVRWQRGVINDLAPICDWVFSSLKSFKSFSTIYFQFYQSIYFPSIKNLPPTYLINNYCYNITYEGNLIKAITRITNIQRLGFSYNFIIYKDTKTKKMILYESNIMNWSYFRVKGNLQGNLSLRELTIN